MENGAALLFGDAETEMTMTMAATPASELFPSFLLALRSCFALDCSSRVYLYLFGVIVAAVVVALPSFCTGIEFACLFALQLQLLCQWVGSNVSSSSSWSSSLFSWRCEATNE